MARTPSMTAEDCERILGPRGSLTVTSENRGTVQKWLVARGIPASVAKSARLSTLAKAYNSETYLQAMLRNIAQRDGNLTEINNQDNEQDNGDMNALAQLNSARLAAENGGDIEAAQQLAAAIMRVAGAAAKPVDEATVRAIVTEEVKKAMAGAKPLVIEVRREGDLVGRIEGRQHPKFATILKAAMAKDASGYAPNVWIAGPAGSGKTRAVYDVAKALNLAFEHNGALAMPHELTGFIDAAGNYHSTAFRRAYQDGSVYLFDEVDASDNAALLALNAALANGHAAFPDRPVERHHDNRIFVAANTWGMGATAEFVGRARIDAAFLDRFPVKIHFDYDEELEAAICGNADFARRVQKARALARQAGLKVAITPRASIGGAALIAAGFSEQEAAELTYLANLTPEQRRQIEG